MYVHIPTGSLTCPQNSRFPAQGMATNTSVAGSKHKEVKHSRGRRVGGTASNTFGGLSMIR